MTATTTETLTVDGVNLKTLAKNISTLAATLRAPGKRGSNALVADRDGSIWTPYKSTDEGSVILPMWIRGCDDDGLIPGGSTARREFYKRVDEITRLFSKDYALLDVRHTLPDTTIRRALCECVEVLDFTTQSPNPLGKVTVALVNPDAYWRDVVATVTQSFTINTDWTWATGGTAPVNDALFKITGPITDAVVKDMVSGCYFKYAAAIPALQRLALNADTFSIGGDGTGFNPDMSKVTYWRTGGRFMRLVPNSLGQYVVQLQGTGTTGATKLEITGYKKYQVG